MVRSEKIVNPKSGMWMGKREFLNYGKHQKKIVQFVQESNGIKQKKY